MTGCWTHLRLTGEGSMLGELVKAVLEWALEAELSAPRGALSYRPRSGHGLEEVSVGLMAYLDP
jgi:hypothetical protein